MGNGQFAKALVDAEAASEIKPEWTKPYFRAGSALLALGRQADAIDSLDKALALDPGNQSVIKIKEQAGANFSPTARGTGCLLTWGAGDFGCLGHGDDRSKPSARVVDGMRGKHVIDVGCGMIHTIAITGAGETFAWGHNQQYQCGLGQENILFFVLFSGDQMPVCRPLATGPCSDAGPWIAWQAVHCCCMRCWSHHRNCRSRRRSSKRKQISKSKSCGRD